MNQQPKVIPKHLYKKRLAEQQRREAQRPPPGHLQTQGHRPLPVLRHFQPGQSFDIMRSDVAAWLCDQPEIRQEVFNIFKRHGAIVYEDGRWRGVAWEP
jgi:hypothetical protein